MGVEGEGGGVGGGLTSSLGGRLKRRGRCMWDLG